MRLSLDVRKPKSTKFETFMGFRNVSINLSNILGQKSESAFFEILFKNIKKYSNIFRPCPFSVISEAPFWNWNWNPPKSLLIAFSGNNLCKQLSSWWLWPPVWPSSRIISYRVRCTFTTKVDGTEMLHGDYSIYVRVSPKSYRIWFVDRV